MADEIVKEEEQTVDELKTVQEKTFTQKEIDSIISERLKKERKNFEKQLSEEKRLAALTAEEQEREKFKIEKEQFESERKTLARERMEIQVAKQLETESLPTSFAKYLLADDAEIVKENIKEFKKEFQSAVEKTVNAKLAGKTPVQPVDSTTDEQKLLDKMRKLAGLK